jgi:hypothetical protein
MASKQPAPAPGDRGRADRAGARAAQERYGALALRRLRKDDGRALIVYSHAGPRGGDGARAEGAG